jgi:elongator complex protein 2
MTLPIGNIYTSAGGNRNSSAADWSATSSLLAFGADQNVAIWDPLHDSGHGINALLGEHPAKVTAVKFAGAAAKAEDEILITGCAAGEVVAWSHNFEGEWTCLHKIKAHSGTINTIACLQFTPNTFVTGGADGNVSLWRIHEQKISQLATLTLKPKFIPLALAAGHFTADHTHDSCFLVVGGTRNDIQVYSLQGLLTSPNIRLCATLAGHEAWIRSLALTSVPEGGFLLASASQDKYVRLWRFQSNDRTATALTLELNAMARSSSSNPLTAKSQSVATDQHAYTITFEALLLGHDDWIYSTTWHHNPDAPPRLLTASADGSLSIWEADPISGIWLSISRLGEISTSKGATTATGSAGGFWTGLWSPDGTSVTCLGRTGSWRLWTYDESTQFWTQRHGATGHIGAVTGICWSPNGNYLLSTSSDQTTRLHAQWQNGQHDSWHEFSRPQIHGYDLNCITSISERQFSSGADEKLLRVFDQPRDIAEMLQRVCGIPLPSESQTMPESAAIPVLGLSNKAMDEDKGDENPEDMTQQQPGEAEDLEANTSSKSSLSLLAKLSGPPTEDLLSRHTLWPEREKLYGHGAEISDAASSSDAGILATACKASSTDHAVIRLYNTNTWHELRPPLTAHSLTATRLSFSPTTNADDSGYLLSVGRDRQWAVFQQSPRASKAWTRVENNAKAHSRMILDATWLPGTPRPSFATAGRDKSVRIWSRTTVSVERRGEQNPPPEGQEAGVAGDDKELFTLSGSITRKSPVTALSAIPYRADGHERSVLAIGEDSGAISIHVISSIEDDGGRSVAKTSVEVPKRLCPSKTANRLAWRPGQHHADSRAELAVASADGSVRILYVVFDELFKS